MFDLLTSRAGYGFASDFSLPAVQLLFGVQKDGREPRSFPPPDAWLAELAQIPLLYQPGQAWLYDACSTLQGVLIGRVSGRSLPDFLAERVFAPLGMTDTGFDVPPAKRERLTSYYRHGGDGGLELADGPDGQWSSPPEFPLGNGGLAGTADDWLAFARMLLAWGTGPGGRRVLTADSVRLMTTDHTTPAQREIGVLFLEGQGWGFGGSVDIAVIDPWNVPGPLRLGGRHRNFRAHHAVRRHGSAILLAQVAADSPVPPEWMRDFWRYAANAALSLMTKVAWSSDRMVRGQLTATNMAIWPNSAMLSYQPGGPLNPARLPRIPSEPSIDTERAEASRWLFRRHSSLSLPCRSRWPPRPPSCWSAGEWASALPRPRHTAAPPPQRSP